MEFLQYLTNPYAVIGLIVFVIAGALGARSKSGGQKAAAPLFFGVALIGLATTIAVAWIDMKKTTDAAQSDSTGTTIKAEDGSNVVTDVDATGSSTININQGGQN